MDGSCCLTNTVLRGCLQNFHELGERVKTEEDRSMVNPPNYPTKLAAFTTAIITIFFISRATCLNFNYTSFPHNSSNDFIRLNSFITANQILITPEFAPNQSGRIFYRTHYRLFRNNRGRLTRSSFTTTFVLRIDPTTRPPGEGLAFILTRDAFLPPNTAGQWLGVTSSITRVASRLANIVAVEFDTRKSYPEDLDDNHVGLDFNSVYSVSQESLSGFGVNLSSSEPIRFRIGYDGANLTVFLVGGDHSERLVLSRWIDLSDHLPETVYVGFSGSTGLFEQRNCILSWEFSGSELSSGNKRFVSLWFGVGISAGGLCLIVSVFALVYRRRKRIMKRKMEDEDNDGEDAQPSIEEAIRGSSTAPRKFKLSELSEATENYHPKNKLGEGGFGTVYKGILENRLVVAVKKVSQVTSQGKQEFVAEVTTIGNLRHKNLVKLIGWARERCEYLLVYEYMPNGSLEKFIFAPESSSVLTWRTRYNIITGVAQALEYLHNGCEKRVLHRDIKASNIMLDSKFEPKLGDFGLARTIMQADQTHHSTKALAGTPGYMAPELFLTGRSTPETDVYAFGILVLEVVCGRKPGGEGGGNLDQYEYAINIVKWVWELYGGERLIDAADRRMEKDSEEEKEEMCRVLTMGLGCCHPDPYNRPSMKTVLQVLTGEEVLTGPEVPLQMPPFFWPPNASSFEDRHSLTGSRMNEQFTEIVGR